jgi:hypothetical protein
MYISNDQGALLHTFIMSVGIQTKILSFFYTYFTDQTVFYTMSSKNPNFFATPPWMTNEVVNGSISEMYIQHTNVLNKLLVGKSTKILRIDKDIEEMSHDCDKRIYKFQEELGFLKYNEEKNEYRYTFKIYFNFLLTNKLARGLLIFIIICNLLLLLFNIL